MAIMKDQNTSSALRGQKLSTIDTRLASLRKRLIILAAIQLILIFWGNYESQSGLMFAGIEQDLAAQYLVPVVGLGLMLDWFITSKRLLSYNDARSWWQRALLSGGILTSAMYSLLVAVLLAGVPYLLRG
jgi:hypothetical protein